MKLIQKNSLFTFLILIAAGCANVQAPSGGPTDTTPPEIVSASIVGSTRNFHERSITLEFSEWVNKAQVPENVFLSPPKRLEFEWSGRELEVIFAEPLDENTTYALTVGTNYTDLYGNNKPTQAYTLIFSTGDRLDSGIIRGKIFADDPSGIFVWVYPLDGINPDTLDPAKTKAKYRTQIGTNGSFEIQALPNGRYRVIAVRDQFGNSLLEPVDAVATANDVSVANGNAVEVRLRMMATPDVEPPQFIDAEPLTNRTVRALFSEELDSTKISSSAFRVENISSSDSIPVSGAFIDPQNGRAVNVVTGAPMTADTRYRITANKISDPAGNFLSDTANSKTFSASSESDTMRVRILTSSVQDSTRNISLDQNFVFIFSGAINRSDLESRINFLQAANKTPYRVEWRGDNIARVIPQSKLTPNTWYELNFSLKGIRAANGQNAKDTTIRIRFLTADTRSFGGVSGTLTDSLADGSPYVISLIGAERRGQRFTKSITAPGAWSFDEIPTGNYTIEVFQDRDKNGVYSPGTAFPFLPGERFFVFETPINIRPRWTVENVKLNLR